MYDALGPAGCPLWVWHVGAAAGNLTRAVYPYSHIKGEGVQRVLHPLHPFYFGMQLHWCRSKSLLATTTRHGEQQNILDYHNTGWASTKCFDSIQQPTPSAATSATQTDSRASRDCCFHLKISHSVARFQTSFHWHVAVMLQLGFSLQHISISFVCGTQEVNEKEIS